VHPRLRLVLIGLVACAAAALAAVSIADRGSGTAATRPRTVTFDGGLRPQGVPPADFALRDERGATVRLAGLRGRPVILTFMYSTCRDTCPLTADQIRGALDDLGGAAPPALAMSVDPANDTPERASAFLLRHKLTGRMRFLLGSRAQLAPLWKAYGIQPQGKAFDHSAYVLLIDRDGRPRIGFPLNQLTPEGLAHDVRLLAAGA
jgi:protein SCO1/2